MDMFRYDFGYSWFVAYGHLVPFIGGAALATLAWWRGWPLWALVLPGLLAAWGVAGLLITHIPIRINAPLEPPAERFLGSGAGRVLDAGAGSGRAAVGLLLARPAVRVTALDIYDGYFGIDDNTPERLMANARIAGVADRVEARTGDMRAMPFEERVFDGVISAYAIDHLRHDGIVSALREVSRVLKPRGELLLLIVNPDGWVWFASPHAIAHHRPPDAGRWATLLGESGFEVLEQGTRPATLFFFAKKR